MYAFPATLRTLFPIGLPSNTHTNTVEVPESFYEATTDDYRVALQAIKANRMRMEEETQMRTKEMKEKDRLRRIPKYRKVRTSPPPCDEPLDFF
jgi:hypothetical protein